MLNKFLHWAFGVPLVWVRFKWHDDWGKPRLTRVKLDPETGGFYASYYTHTTINNYELMLEKNGGGKLPHPYSNYEWEWRPYRSRRERTIDDFKLPLGFDIHTFSERLEKS